MVDVDLLFLGFSGKKQSVICIAWLLVAIDEQVKHNQFTYPLSNDFKRAFFSLSLPDFMSFGVLQEAVDQPRAHCGYELEIV